MEFRNWFCHVVETLGQKVWNKQLLGTFVQLLKSNLHAVVHDHECKVGLLGFSVQS